MKTWKIKFFFGLIRTYRAYKFECKIKGKEKDLKLKDFLWVIKK